MREAAAVMAMPAGMARIAGVAALAAGVLRIASAFIPYVPDSVALEALYAVIDVAFLFGTMGIVLAAWPWLGGVGQAGAGVLLAGIASIVGPDGVVGGVNMYQAGLGVIALGSLVTAIALLRARLFQATAWIWISAAGLGIAGTLAGSPEVAMLAGVAFGYAYVAAGIRLVRR